MLFVDDAYRTPEESVDGTTSSTIQRQLPDGRTFRVIKWRTLPRVSSSGWSTSDGTSPSPPPRDPSTGDSAAEFRVEDVDAEFRNLRLRDVDVVMEPTTQPWGNRSMLFRDPDGNLINFFTPTIDGVDPSERKVSVPRVADDT